MRKCHYDGTNCIGPGRCKDYKGMRYCVKEDRARVTTYVLEAQCPECGHINSRYSSVIPLKGFCDFCKKDLLFKLVKKD